MKPEALAASFGGGTRPAKGKRVAKNFVRVTCKVGPNRYLIDIPKTHWYLLIADNFGTKDWKTFNVQYTVTFSCKVEAADAERAIEKSKTLRPEAWSQKALAPTAELVKKRA